MELESPFIAKIIRNANKPSLKEKLRNSLGFQIISNLGVAFSLNTLGCRTAIPQNCIY